MHVNAIQTEVFTAVVEGSADPWRHVQADEVQSGGEVEFEFPAAERYTDEEGANLTVCHLVVPELRSSSVEGEPTALFRHVSDHLMSMSRSVSNSNGILPSPECTHFSFHSLSQSHTYTTSLSDLNIPYMYFEFTETGEQSFISSLCPQDRQNK